MPNRNKLVIDLEGLDLSEVELKRISSSVQSAVLNELANFPQTGGANLGVIPGIKHPEWIGLIVRDLNDLDIGADVIDKLQDRIKF